MSNIDTYLKRFSSLLDAMLETECNCLETRCTSHQQRTIQNELKLKFMLELMDVIMKKLDVIEDRVFIECMTCDVCSLSPFVLQYLLEHNLKDN